MSNKQNLKGKTITDKTEKGDKWKREKGDGEISTINNG